jgi:hypothetical protein
MDAEHADFMVLTDPKNQFLAKTTRTLRTEVQQKRKGPRMQPVRQNFYYSAT